MRAAVTLAATRTRPAPLANAGPNIPASIARKANGRRVIASMATVLKQPGRKASGRKEIGRKEIGRMAIGLRPPDRKATVPSAPAVVA